MELTNDQIDGKFNKTLLTKYIEGVISTQPLDGVLDSLTYHLEVYGENESIESIEAIDKSKVEYVILVTKLSTMIEIFNILKNDDNIVMVDELEKEIIRFQDLISESIKKTNKELINE